MPVFCITFTYTGFSYCNTSILTSYIQIRPYAGSDGEVFHDTQRLVTFDLGTFEMFLLTDLDTVTVSRKVDFS